jgi:hypothetical protein
LRLLCAFAVKPKIMKTQITPTTTKKINSFWRWFLNHEIEIIKALLYQENYNEIFSTLNKKLSFVSKKIGFIIKTSDKEKEKFKIIFTAHGNPKLFPKINALEEYAVDFFNWTVQSFIKPEKDIEQFKNGLDDAYVFQDFELKTSELYFSVIDYNIQKKKLNIIIYLKNYTFHCENDFLEEAVYIVLQEFIGEVALYKNINFVQMGQVPNNNHKLVHLYELQEYIDKINTINRNKNKHL